MHDPVEQPCGGYIVRLMPGILTRTTDIANRNDDLLRASGAVQSVCLTWKLARLVRPQGYFTTTTWDRNFRRKESFPLFSVYNTDGKTEIRRREEWKEL